MPELQKHSICVVLARLWPTRGHRTRSGLAAGRFGNSGIRGQVILEAVFFLLWFAGFLAMTFFFYNVFEISQKQTMLLRTQAFIELGNFSNFGGGSPGTEKASDSKNQLTFVLGEKTKNTHIDLDAAKPFKKRVEGELDLRGQFLEDGDYLNVEDSNKDKSQAWNAYQFPRNKTLLRWQSMASRDKDFEFPNSAVLQQTLSIVMNRSIDPAGPNKAKFQIEEEQDIARTGIFSGSLSLSDYSKLLRVNLEPLKGLSDNLDALKARARELVKDDPSLADEAEKLEKTIKGSELDNSAAIASLINMAISIALQAGMSALGGALEAIKTGGDVGAGAASGAADSLQTTFGSMMNNPVSLAASGNLLAAPVSAVSEVVMTPVSGFDKLTNGVAAVREGGAGTLSGAFSAAAGAGKLVGTYEMGMNFSGKTVAPGVQVAKLGLMLPEAVTDGWRSFLGNFKGHDELTHSVDVIGAVKDLPQVILPVTTIVALTSPDLAVPLGVVNASLVVTSAAAGGLEALSDVGTAQGDFAKYQNAKTIGELTTYTGAMVSGVGVLTKNTNLMQTGGYLTASGAALYTSASAAESLAKLKLEKPDFKIGNPISGAGYLIKKNIDNGLAALSGLRDDLSNGFHSIGVGLKNLTTPLQKNEDYLKSRFEQERANKMTGLMAKLDLDSIKDAATTRMDYAVVNNPDIDPAIRAEVAGMRDELAKNYDIVKAANENGLLARTDASKLDPELQKAGALAAKDGADIIEKYLSMKNSNGKLLDSIGQDQIKSIRLGRAEADLETIAIGEGKSVKNTREAEKDAADKNIFYGLKTLRGDRQSLKTWNFQENLMMNMKDFEKARTAAVANDKKKQKIEDLDKKYLKLAQGISVGWAIPSRDANQISENAGYLADRLEEAATRYPEDSARRSQFLAEVPKLRKLQREEVKVVTPEEEIVIYTESVEQGKTQLRLLRGALQQKLLQVCDNQKCMRIATARDLD